MPAVSLFCVPFDQGWWSRTRETSECCRLRSRKRPAPAQSAPLTSSDEDAQPLSRLRSHAGQTSGLRSDMGNGTEDTRSKRASRRLSSARNGKVALASENKPEEEKDEPMPARRRNLRQESDVPGNQGAEFQERLRTPAGNHSRRSTRAATGSNRAQPAEQEDQPERALRSRSTRTKTAAPQQDGSPENSSDEEPEPERHYERSARQARKASKLVQGGGGMSDDEDSASGEKARHCRRSNAETRRSRCLRSYPIAASYKRKICWTPNWA